MSLSAYEYSLLALDTYIRPTVSPSTTAYPLDASFIDQADDRGMQATAYQVGSEIIIAFRGSQTVDDYASGWLLHNGQPGPQGMAAIDFYLAVSAANPTATITLTGHSLGGGLAGFVSSIYGLDACVFDAAPYSAAASVVYDDCTGANGPVNAAWLDIIYNGGPVPALDPSGIDGYHIDGEFLDPDAGWLVSRGVSEPSTELSMPDGEELPHTGILGSAQTLHSLSLLSMRLYAQQLDLSDWEPAAKFVFGQLFGVPGDTTASLAGYSELFEGLNFDRASDLVQTLIAQAGPSGNAGLSGNSALAAFWNDADDLGRAIGLGAANGEALGQLLSIYAGTLARLAVMDDHLDGILNTDEENDVLLVDLSDETWTFDGLNSEAQIGRSAFANALLESAGISDNIVDLSLASSFRFALGQGFSGELETSDAVFVGTANSDTITGSEASDTIFGGFSIDSPVADTINGGDGDDVIVGTAGGDTLNGDGGDDYIEGGAGADTIDGGSGADALFGGTGDDTLYLTDGDLAVGGLGNDIYVVAPGGTGPMVIVAGEGVDSFKIVAEYGASVAFIEVEGLTNEENYLLDAQALAGFGNGADVVIVNASINDKLYFNEQLVSGGTYGVNAEASYESFSRTAHTFTYFPYMLADGEMTELTFTVNDGGTLHSVAVPTRVTFHDTTYTQYQIASGSLSYSGSYGTLRVTDTAAYLGYGEGPIYAGLAIEGWSNSLAGVTIFGNGAEYETTWLSSEYRVLGWDWENRSPEDLANIVVNSSGAYLYVPDPYVDDFVLGELASTPLSGGGWSSRNVIDSTVGGSIVVKVDDVLKAMDSRYLFGTSGNDTLTGGSNSDVLDGAEGDDDLKGRGGDDTITGGIGNDTLLGGRGDDYLLGGTGDDTYRFSAGDGSDTVDDAAGNDTVILADLDVSQDVQLRLDRYDLIILNTETFDTIRLANQLDGQSIEQVQDGFSNTLTAALLETMVISTGSYLAGSADSETFLGDSSSQTFDALEGDDFLDGGAGADTFLGGDGYDTVSYRRSAGGITFDVTNSSAGTGDAAGDILTDIEVIFGTRFADSITSEGQDVFGDGGNDTIIGLGLSDHWFEGADGNDIIIVSHGNNYLSGGAGDDNLTGGDGDDTISTGSGADVVHAGDGNDLIETGPGVDAIDGGAGFDWVSYTLSEAGVTLDLASPSNNAGETVGDTLLSIEGFIGTYYDDLMVAGEGAVSFRAEDGDDVLIGSEFSDTLDGGWGNDEFDAGGGDDVINGGYGADTINGGDGFDTVTFADLWGPVVVDLSNLSNNTGAAEGDTFASVENIIGTNEGDTLVAHSAPMTLDGATGDDNVSGGSAADTIIGGADDDLLFGGLGDDTFRFDLGSGNDTVTDFQIHNGLPNGDTIEIIGRGALDFNQLMLDAQQVGSDTVLDLGDGDTIVLSNIAKVDLSGADFWFH